MTIIVLLSVAIVLIIYDIIVVALFGRDETISWQMWLISQKYPVIPFALGFVMGHILWHNCGAS
jgi:hypothetical protein